MPESGSPGACRFCGKPARFYYAVEVEKGVDARMEVCEEHRLRGPFLTREAMIRELGLDLPASVLRTKDEDEEWARPGAEEMFRRDE